MRAEPRDFPSEPATGVAEQAAPAPAGTDPFEIHVVATDRIDGASSMPPGQDGPPAGALGEAGQVGMIVTKAIAGLRELRDTLRASPAIRSVSIAGALVVAFGFGWACGSIFDSGPDAEPVPLARKAELAPARPEPQRDVKRGHRIAAAPRPAPVESSRPKPSASAANTRLIASAVAQLQAEPQTTSSLGLSPAASDFNPPPVLSPVPETRPTTIAGWSVRDVDGDKAVLVGPDHVWTVRAGDNVPGVGRIDSIVRWGNRWIVATTAGLISTE
jgi:hypothetical protein